jgi:hypothetical protein
MSLYFSLFRYLLQLEGFMNSRHWQLEMYFSKTKDRLLNAISSNILVSLATLYESII